MGVFGRFVEWVIGFDLHPPRRRTLGLVLACYLTALLAGALLVHTCGDGETESDFYASYGLEAQGVLHGQVPLDRYRGPVYPIAVALVHLISSLLGADIFASGKILSCLASAAVLALSYRMITMVFSPAIGLGALILTMCNPTFVRYSYTAGTDMFFVALALGATCFFIRQEKLLWRNVVLTGVMCQLCIMTRYNGVAIGGGVLAAIVFLNYFRVSRRRRIAVAGVMIATMVILYIPYGAYAKRVTGEFFLNRNYENVVYAVYAGDQVEQFMQQHSQSFDSAWDVVRFDPGRFVLRVAWNALVRFSQALQGVALWPVGSLALVLIMLRAMRPPGRRQTALYAIVVAFFLVLALVTYSPRFYLFVVPVVAAMAVDALRIIGSAMGPGPRVRSGIVAVVVLLSGYSAVLAAAYNRVYLPGGLKEICQAGQIYADTFGRGDGTVVVAARKPHFGYYAGMTTIPLPRVSDVDELKEYLRSRGASYLFFSHVASATRPELAALMDSKQTIVGLKPVMWSEAGVLYAVDLAGN